jgi:hypothetical protein
VIGVAAPRTRGARREDTCCYLTDEQRSDLGCCGDEDHQFNRVEALGDWATYLLGCAIAQGSRAAEALAREAANAECKGRREAGLFALGFALTRSERWQDFRALVHGRSEEEVNSLVRGAVILTMSRQPGANPTAQRFFLSELLREEGLEPLVMASLAHKPVPATARLASHARSQLIVELGTKDRGHAVRALAECAALGAPLGPAPAPLLGTLFCGDYADPNPYQALLALACAGRNGADLRVAAPFLAAFTKHRGEEVRLAAWEAIAHAGHCQVVPLELQALREGTQAGGQPSGVPSRHTAEFFLRMQQGPRPQGAIDAGPRKTQADQDSGAR